MLHEKSLTEKIISAAIEVHRTLGPGLLESAYEESLCREFELRGIPFERQKLVPLHYKDRDLDCDYRLDIIVAGKIIVELKCVEKVQLIHRMQLLTYLRLYKLKVGLLLNFYVPVLKEGIHRVIA